MTVEAQWFGDGAKARKNEAVQTGLRIASDHLLAKSREIVPFLEGILSASGSVDIQPRLGIVSYNTPYAIRQHEELSYRHRDGRQAKYLEKPLKSESKQIREIIQRTVNASLRGG